MQKFEYIKLLDVYGRLLTENQQEIMKLYYGYDLSLSEIAEEKGVSRQSVSECINKSRRQLEEYEESVLAISAVNSLREENKILAEKVSSWANSFLKEYPEHAERLKELFSYVNKEQ